MIHYHIRWSNSKLDWEAFSTPDEAQAQAEQLVRLGESYVIEQLDGDCPRCSGLRNLGGHKVASSLEKNSGPKKNEQSSNYEKIVKDCR